MSVSNRGALSDKTVAIIGRWCRVPGADSPDRFWVNLCSGVETIQTLSKDDLERAGISSLIFENPCYVARKGMLEFADFFDADFFGVTPAEAELTDPQHRQFLECAWLALADAGYFLPGAELRAGVYAAQSSNDYRLAIQETAAPETARGFSADVANGVSHLAANVAYRLDLRGPTLTVQTACSSSLVAVHLACRSLLSGECDLAIAGGVSICWPQQTGYLYVQDGVMSRDGICRPFDERACGTVRGEGVGVVILKRFNDALRDRDNMHALINGSAVNNDGRVRLGYAAPSAIGQTDVVRRAMEAAGVKPQDIGFLEAHGTATPLGDSVELAALREALGPKEPTQQRWLGSVKANIGHLDAASGIIGLIKAAEVVRYGVVPPLVNFNQFAEEAKTDGAAFDVPKQVVTWEARGRRCAGVSSFGIGGTNAHVVIEKAPPILRTPSARLAQLILLAADTPEGLFQVRQDTAQALEAPNDFCIADVSYTLAVGRRHGPWRAAMIADSVETLRELLVRDLVPSAAFENRQPALVFRNCNGPPPSWVADSCATEPCFRRWFDVYAEKIGFMSGGAKRRRSPMRSRQFGPADRDHFCALFALGRTLLDFGLRPSAVLGEGIGELVAACIAGFLGVEDAVTLLGAAEETSEADVGRRMSEALAYVTPRKGDLVWISTVTGAPVEEAAVCDSSRWQRTFENEPGFSSGRFWCDQQQLVINVNHALTVGSPKTLAEALPVSLKDASHSRLLELIGAVWLAGATLDWKSFFSDELRRRVSLPSPPLTRRRFAPAQTCKPATDGSRAIQLGALDEEGTDSASRPDKVAMLIRIMEEVLGIRGIQPSDDFFALGGCSLTAVDVLSRFRAESGCELSLRQFLERGTAERIVRTFVRREALVKDRQDAGSVPILFSAGTVSSFDESAQDNLQRSVPLTFSVFFFAGEAPEVSRADTYSLVIDAARFADSHGFDAVWLPERHFNRFGGLFPNPAVLGAALATSTNRVAIRAGSVVVPLHRPIEVVEQWAVVDILSGGRVGISVAPGFHAVDFVLNPGAYEQRRDEFWSQLELIRQLWRGEYLNSVDGLGRPIRIRSMPRPVQHEMPLWITASESEETFVRAGQLGANVLTGLLALDCEGLKIRLERYRQALSQVHPGRRGHVTVMLHAFVHSDPAVVRAVAHPALRHYLDTHLEFASTRGEYARIARLNSEDRAALLDHATARYTNGRSLIGTPEECAVTITRLAALGVDEIACLVDFGITKNKVLQSLGEIARMRETVHDPLSQR